MLDIYNKHNNIKRTVFKFGTALRPVGNPDAAGRVSGGYHG